MSVLSLPAFYLCGPTASGKSSVAIALAQRIGGEIINADAFQLYQGLDLCTAKPSLEDRALVLHHLFDVLDPVQACDAQHYHDLALPMVEKVLSRQRWPIIVGGSGLYVKALTHGLANLPKGDAALRAQLDQMTAAERVAELLRRDPAAAGNVPLNNDRYVSRALEICLITGQPQSTLRQQWQQNQPTFLGALLERDRDDLYQRINARVLSMIEAGVVEEVKAFLAEVVAGVCDPGGVAQGMSPAPSIPHETNPVFLNNEASQVRPHRGQLQPASGLKPPAPSPLIPASASPVGPSPSALRSPPLTPRPPSLLSAIGVREIQAFLHGACSLEEAITAMQQATRRYAQRQMTWFRREHGFQTICLAAESNPDFVTQRLIETFPCLCHPPQSAPSSSI